MTNYLIIALVLLVAVVGTVLVMQRPSRPVPDLDAQMIETAKHLHPPKLSP